MAPPGRGISACTTMAWDWDLLECIGAWTRAGLRGIGVGLPQFEQAGRDRSLRELRASELTVSDLQGVYLYDLVEPARFTKRQQQALTYLDIAAELGVDCVTAEIAPRGTLSWNEAARHVVEQTVAVLPEIRARNLRLAIEPVHPLRQDVSFINLAADAVEIVRRVDDPSFGYLFDTYHLWWQRGIEELARQSADHVFCVQVSDHKAVTLRTQDRAMPGQGIIPLHGLLQSLVDGGYAGWWELEVISDQNAAMGIDVALRAAVRGLDEAWASGQGAEPAPA
ncbi:MAG: sugar phosphate isomerase/epimerase family protein [Acidimicrobiales bacterium]|jgi:sugar phosphate isomerase/epimerase